MNVRSTLRGLVVGLVLGLAGPAIAVTPDEILPDPALEARARQLSLELRCLVCQNQSIDDSNAELAKDLRVLVRERLVAGDSDSQVLDYVVARYGEFVLLKPRLSARTLLLWGVPLLLVGVGGIAAWRYAAAHRPSAATTAAVALDDAERERLRELMRDRDA